MKNSRNTIFSRLPERFANLEALGEIFGGA